MATYRRDTLFDRFTLTCICTFCGKPGAIGHWTASVPEGGYVEVCEACALRILPALIADALERLHLRNPQRLGHHVKNAFLKAYAYRAHRELTDPPVHQTGNPKCPSCWGEGFLKESGKWCDNCVEVVDRVKWGGLRDFMQSEIDDAAKLEDDSEA